MPNDIEVIKLVNTKDLEIHPLHKKLFPNPLDAAIAARMLDDIRNRGIQTPLIVTKDKKVICGRERFRIARELGLKRVPVIVRDYPDDNAMKIDLIADNTLRRQLKVTELAALGREVEEMLGVKQGRPTKDESAKRKASGAKYEGGDIKAKAAKKLGVSSGALRRAQKASDNPEAVRKAVDDGVITLALAEKISAMPKKLKEKADEICKEFDGEELVTKIRTLVRTGVADDADALADELKQLKYKVKTLGTAIAESSVLPGWSKIPRALRVDFIETFRKLQEQLKPYSLALKEEISSAKESATNGDEKKSGNGKGGK